MCLQPFPLESSLVAKFGSYLNVEVASGRVKNASTALSFLASTFLAVRVDKNPLFYGVQNRTFFSDLIASNLKLLVGARCCQPDFSPLPLGMVAARFDLLPSSVKMLAEAVAKCKQVGGSFLALYVFSF
jgi:hypothetical protein